MLIKKALFIAVIVSVGLGAASAAAKTTERQRSLGTFGSWHTYRFYEKERPVCYMSLYFSVPEHEGRKTRHRRAQLTITQRPGNGSRDVVSYTSGYSFEAGSNVKAVIGDKTYDLFTVKDTAWTRDATADRRLTADIREQWSISFTGMPKGRHARHVKDTFRLAGSTKAYRTITKACGMKPPEEEKPHITSKKSHHSPARKHGKHRHDTHHKPGHK